MVGGRPLVWLVLCIAQHCIFLGRLKKIFWGKMSKGRLPREIISTLGIDPNILGDSRINGLKTMIGNEVKREMVFEILTPMHRAATDIFRLKIG